MKLNFIFLFVFLFLSCRTEFIQKRAAKSELTKMKWLLGEWEMLIENSVLYESWKNNNEKFLGNSFMSIDSDTVFSETMSLEMIDNKLCYVVMVKNQNNNKPVVFSLNDVKNNEYHFENKEHDFPQKIVYKKLSVNRIYASIEGLNKGVYQKDSFLFNRINTSQKQN